MTHRLPESRIVKNEKELNDLITEVDRYNESVTYLICDHRKLFVPIDENENIITRDGYPVIVTLDSSMYEESPFNAVSSKAIKQFNCHWLEKLSNVQDKVAEMLK